MAAKHRRLAAIRVQSFTRGRLLEADQGVRQAWQVPRGPGPFGLFQRNEPAAVADHQHHRANDGDHGYRSQDYQQNHNGPGHDQHL